MHEDFLSDETAPYLSVDYFNAYKWKKLSNHIFEKNFSFLFITCFIIFHSRRKVELSIGGESFHCTGTHVTVKGFTSIMPWLAVNENNIPSFTKGQKIEMSKLELYEVI